VAAEPSGTPPPATPPPGSRVAVIVVPGVGDDARGATVESVGAHLATHGYRHGERRELLTSQHPQAGEAYSSVWVRLTRGDLAEAGAAPSAPSTVDLYEMRWSDLSRFPSKTAAFLLSAWGLVLQIPTLALEALYHLRKPTDDHPQLNGTFPTTSTASERLRKGLELLSWWLAVPLLLIPASLVILVVALWLAFNSYATGLTVLALFSLLALALGAAVVGGRKLRGGGWGTFTHRSLREAARAGPLRAVWYVITHPAYWAVGIVIAVLVLFLVRVERDQSLAVASANTALVVAAFPLRIVWLLASLIVLATLVLTLWMALRARREHHPYGPRARRTSVAAIAFAPLGLAIVNSVALGLTSGVLLRLSRSGEWSPDERPELKCLADSRDWAPGACSDAVAQGPEIWGRELFGQTLAPAVVVGVLLLGVLVLVLGFFFTYVLALVLKSDPGEQGTTLRAGLRHLGRFGPWLILAAMVLSVIGLWATWVDVPGVAAPWLDELIDVGGAYAVAAVLAAGLAIGTSFLPRGGPFRVIWTAMDVIYDIAAYRRISHHGITAPRDKMFDRYTGLLNYIAQGRDGLRYDRIVILAHSQGCLVTVGALFGEPEWEESALERTRREDAEAGRPWTTPPISLITCGNPISQLYRSLLPGSYDWIANRMTPSADRPWPLAEWVNLYRAGDYVGRAIWRIDDLEDPAAWTPDVHRAEGDWGTTVTAEWCIGRGMHTGYWSQKEILDQLSRMIDGTPLIAPGEAPGALSPQRVAGEAVRP
jgi:hypothetical protein